MTTTTGATRHGKRFDNGKDSEKGTGVPATSPGAPEWFNAQVLPGLPLHLELILMGVWEVEGAEN